LTRKVLWFFLAVLIVSRSQVGKALADWIANHGGAPYSLADLEGVEHRLEDRLLELEERVEDTERVLQRQRRSAGLPPID